MLRPLCSEEGPSTGPSIGPSTGPSRGLRGAFYGAFKDKAEGLRGEGRKRRLHPLGEYVSTLYTIGKLHTRVTESLHVKA
ncbi:hypothetical protein Tco_1025289 [Tanacetum coccineum]